MHSQEEKFPAGISRLCTVCCAVSMLILPLSLPRSGTEPMRRAEQPRWGCFKCTSAAEPLLFGDSWVQGASDFVVHLPAGHV